MLREKAPTEPRVHRQLKMDVQEEELVQHAARKIDLAGEVEEAAEYRYQNGIPAYACSTELPIRQCRSGQPEAALTNGIAKQSGILN
ncbi:hypothetical protein [Bradyrhizobium lablabi]|uniref:hypothetical protein n=1 Tax=Bradyrhizobium lablabi TaxID=722472 RepID=UPI0012AB7F58|nr:hypothetical protein [Bradyrhizobium lablabi]